MSDRQLALWDIRAVREPINGFKTLDSINAITLSQPHGAAVLGTGVAVGLVSRTFLSYIPDDIEAGAPKLTLNIGDIVQSQSWSANGSLLVTTSRDKK
jgi:hypothetical protein